MKRKKNGVWELTDAEMNALAYACGRGAEWLKEHGYEYLEGKLREEFTKITNMLDDAGFYDDIRKEVANG